MINTLQRIAALGDFGIAKDSEYLGVYWKISAGGESWLVSDFSDGTLEEAYIGLRVAIEVKHKMKFQTIEVVNAPGADGE